MSEVKSWRIYFNAHADYPLVWSVDEWSADTERKVRAVHVMVPCATCYRQNEGEPRAFLCARGRLIVSDLLEAYIFAHEFVG